MSHIKNLIEAVVMTASSDKTLAGLTQSEFDDVIAERLNEALVDISDSEQEDDDYE